MALHPKANWTSGDEMTVSRGLVYWMGTVSMEAGAIWGRKCGWHYISLVDQQSMS